MISVNNLTVSFGSFDLFKDITFMINPRDRIGLVGKNGAGKSTMMKIIAGLDQPSSGQITMPSGLNVGYLPQQMLHKDTRSVFDETLMAFEEVLTLQKEVERCTIELSERMDYESEDYLHLATHLHECSDRLSVLESSSMEANVEQILVGLGFERTEFSRPTSELSGGWRMRIELAKILLRRPNVFLLDEPTNHLDIESIQWLETFLKEYPGSVVLVSHDRAFLDNVTNRTLEISLGKITDYKVPYSQYVELRKERREQQVAAFNNQQKMIEDTEKFIERFRYKATKSVQVQSRIKQLDKIDRLEIDEEDTSTLRIKFPPAPRSGQIVIEAKALTKRFDEKLVLDETEFIIERGEKVAFVGRNGEGKSTMIKIVMGELPYDGECKLGHNVKIGYFAQNQAQMLDPNITVFDTIDRVAVGDIRTKIRDILGAFLFGGETIDKKVSVLSGGEKSRLALAKLLLEPYSMLVLDEPTNHLDLRSKDVLKQALLQYDGTLVVVSHDRDFLDGLVEKVYEFRYKKIKEYIGGIYEFLEKKKLASLKDIEIKDKQTKQVKEEKATDSKVQYQEKKEFERNLRKLKNQITKCEENIEKLEAEIAACEATLASPGDVAIDAAFFAKYEKFQKDLEAEMESWEQLNMEAEEMENLNN
jgi:ATP-binding cassette, subfamily F, member 3